MDISFTSQFLNELEYFTDKKFIVLQSPVNEEDIHAAEKELDCSFSPQMAFFLKHINGGIIMETIISGVKPLHGETTKEHDDIVETNLFLRTFPSGWDPNLVEIGIDGFGCFYVFDKSKKLENGEYAIGYLDHEDIGKGEPFRKYATGYFEFLLKVIEDMKLVYSPNGELNDLL